jgi:hypothetical protein
MSDEFVMLMGVQALILFVGISLDMNAANRKLNKILELLLREQKGPVSKGHETR